MPRWLHSQQVQLLWNTIITLKFFSQPNAESFRVRTRNPSFIPARKLRSQALLMFLDIRIHQGGVLQDSVVCFVKIFVLYKRNHIEEKPSPPKVNRLTKWHSQQRPSQYLVSFVCSQGYCISWWSRPRTKPWLRKTRKRSATLREYSLDSRACFGTWRVYWVALSRG